MEITVLLMHVKTRGFVRMHTQQAWFGDGGPLVKPLGWLAL